MPFGGDANDLPVHHMQEQFNKGLKVLLESTARHVPAYRYDEETAFAVQTGIYDFNGDLPTVAYRFSELSEKRMSKITNYKERQQAKGKLHKSASSSKSMESFPSEESSHSETVRIKSEEIQTARIKSEEIQPAASNGHSKPNPKPLEQSPVPREKLLPRPQVLPGISHCIHDTASPRRDVQRGGDNNGQASSSPSLPRKSRDGALIPIPLTKPESDIDTYSSTHKAVEQ